MAMTGVALPVSPALRREVAPSGSGASWAAADDARRATRMTGAEIRILDS
jgi:hypothetical protein